MEKIPLAFWCAVVVCYQTQFEVHTADAFSVFRPESITSTLTYSSSSYAPRRSPTSLFLFSLQNDNNGDGDGGKSDDATKEEGPTATMERSGGWNPDEESEDFSAWMEGLKMGTPLGKMASSAVAPEENGLVDPADDSVPAGPSPTKAVNSVSLRESKRQKDSSSAALKINPLSNLIQFEAMLELAKIAGTKDAEEKEIANVETENISSALDVFAVVDGLVKTFHEREYRQAVSIVDVQVAGLPLAFVNDAVAIDKGEASHLGREPGASSLTRWRTRL